MSTCCHLLVSQYLFLYQTVLRLLHFPYIEGGEGGAQKIISLFPAAITSGTPQRNQKLAEKWKIQEKLVPSHQSRDSWVCHPHLQWKILVLRMENPYLKWNMLVYKGKPEKSWSQHNKVGVPSSFEVGRGVNFLPKNLKGERFLTIDFISLMVVHFFKKYF